MEAELINKVAEWKAKAEAGTITLEEMKSAILFMREHRRTAETSSAKRPSAAKRPAKSADDLLNELEGL